MADKYSKKPSVQRFVRQKTYAGRDIKRTRVVRRNRSELRGRRIKTLRKMR